MADTPYIAKSIHRAKAKASSPQKYTTMRKTIDFKMSKTDRIWLFSTMRYFLADGMDKSDALTMAWIELRNKKWWDKRYPPMLRRKPLQYDYTERLELSEEKEFNEI